MKINKILDMVGKTRQRGRPRKNESKSESLGQQSQISQNEKEKISTETITQAESHDSSVIGSNEQVLNQQEIQQQEQDQQQVNQIEAENTGNDEIEEEAGYNPFAAPPQQREYSRPEIAKGYVEDIPEDNINKPTPEEILSEQPFLEEDVEKIESQSTKTKSEKKQDEPEKPSYERGTFSNPDLKDLPRKEKIKSAEIFAETIVNAYEMLHAAGYRWLSLEDNKIQKRILNQKIHPDLLDCLVPVAADGSQNVRFIEFIHGYNEQLKDVLVLNPDVRQEMKELLTEIAMEEGWGLSSKQRLLFLVGTDMITKVTLALSLKAQFEQIVDHFNSQLVKPNQQQQQQQRQQPPKQEQFSEPEEQ